MSVLIEKMCLVLKISRIKYIGYARKPSKHNTALGIDKMLFNCFQADTSECRSVNTVFEVDDAFDYPVEFFDSPNLPGFPPRLLNIKSYAMVHVCVLFLLRKI